ncbi:MAG: C40 family peptidase [Bdellovibrionales bacterium]
MMVAAARSCLNTPFAHQGRVPGVGLDCAGLIIYAAQEAGIVLHDTRAYALPVAPAQLLGVLGENNLQPTALISRGALLLFRLGGQPQHLALATSHTTMIHAYAPAGKVVETTIGTAWRNRLIGIYTFSKE